MTIPDQAHKAAHIVDDTKVIKDLEQRGIQGLDSLSLEELELLAERKRKQLHLEAIEKKARLEGEITRIGEQIQELQARKAELETELRAMTKSLGLAKSGGERSAPRKPKKNAESERPSPPEA